MKILVNDDSRIDDLTNKKTAEAIGKYILEKDINDVVRAITCPQEPFYYYALINGEVFKSDEYKGLKSIFFSTQEKLKNALSNALYWRRKIIPHIGCNCGYNTHKFYEDLCKEAKIEIKRVIF